MMAAGISHGKGHSLRDGHFPESGDEGPADDVHHLLVMVLLAGCKPQPL